MTDEQRNTFNKAYGKFCDEFGKILIPAFIDDLLQKEREKVIEELQHKVELRITAQRQEITYNDFIEIVDSLKKTTGESEEGEE